MLGYAAFLLPMGILRAGRCAGFAASRSIRRWRTLIGYALLMLSLPALLALWRVPEVRGAIPPGGLLGTLLADGLHAAFNSVGAHVVALAYLLSGAVPDDAVFVYRHARAGARAGGEAESAWAG